MHPNPSFRKESETNALNFARSRGFGIVAINGENGPLSAHIPFVISQDGTRAIAHLVASNPLYQNIKAGPERALVSVSGPDAYISPDWYESPNQVPTWNYVAVNLRGALAACPQESLGDALEALSHEFEARLVPKPIWKMNKVDPDALARMMRQIRPIELTIDAVESTYKLGQNKPKAARNSAAEALRSSGIGTDIAQLAKLMIKARGA